MKTNDDGYLTKAEVARRLCRTPRTVETWMKAGRIPFLRVGRSVLFHWPTIEQYMKANFAVLPREVRSARLRARRGAPEKVDPGAFPTNSVSPHSPDSRATIRTQKNIYEDR